MRIVITGGAGFIGSHLCDYLIAKDHEIICVDNLLTGKAENIVHLIGNGKFRFIKHNVSDYIYVDGNHEHEYVKKDLKNYWPKVKKGGIFAGNDIQTLGVSGALIEFCYKNKLVPYIKHVDWWVVKRKD